MKRNTHTRSTFSTPLSKRRVMHAQEIATNEAGFCGFAVAKGPLLPGKTWHGEINFNAKKCKDPVYSVVAKLGKVSKHERRRMYPPL